jgi:hypothetical protein
MSRLIQKKLEQSNNIFKIQVMTNKKQAQLIFWYERIKGKCQPLSFTFRLRGRPLK